jgi:hypothetical protein
MLRFRNWRRVSGFTLVEVLVVTGIMTSLNSAGGGFQYAINAANETKGINNLKQIHMLLTAQGELPKAALYPKGDPKTDPTSILMQMRDAPAELFVSPFAPEELKRKGLTYAWNDTLNGKDLGLVPKDTWLLIDMAAFSADPNVPKPQKFLVLYADGRAMAVMNLPGDIAAAVAQVQAKMPPAQPKAAPKK